ncbi:hypothetical protein GCM10027449_18300 [Sinomonas notoginsengisoli]|uniref:hypothetical protein n=1 Tax=Sinomonas notoginsengisoli TaxID=1457311 RepID=UPI001F2F0FF8|nr:hypothetical protein [Sinomonas notoginsengisoli]
MSDSSKSPSAGHHNASVLGPFTVRDLTLFGGVLVTFVGSLLPLLDRSLPANLWNASNLFFLTIGVLAPVAAAALFAWRRFSPGQRLRVGSLSVDQFASVVAVLSASFYFVLGVTSLTAGAVVGLLGGLAMLASTTVARLIPPFAADFDGRPEVPAHVVARDAAPTAHRPKPASKPAEGFRGASSARHGAAVGAAAWAGAGPVSERPGEAAGVPGAGPATGGPVSPLGREAEDSAESAAPSAAGAETMADAPHLTVASGATAASVRRRERSTEVDEADLQSSAEPSARSEVSSGYESFEDDGARHEEFGRPHDDHGARAGAVGHAGDAAALEAAETHVAAPTDSAGPEPDRATALHSTARDETGPEEAPGGTFGEADGEAYGAPDPLPEAAGPATAVFPSPSSQLAPQGHGSSGSVPGPRRGADIEDIGATAPYEEPEPYEAFWFAVSQPRTAVEPRTGHPLFPLEPGQWILALQDRGHEFVVQSPDGRVGVLRELSGIERG